MDWGLKVGPTKPEMVKQAGSVLESFAYAHPFLEGNGRTIMIVHTVLAERAGFRRLLI